MLMDSNKKINDKKNDPISIPDNLTIYAGNTAKIAAVSKENEDIQVISMESADPDIAAVIAGNVIAYNTGNTKILTTVKMQEETVTFTTQVAVIAGDIVITPEISKIRVGETVKLKARASCGVFKSIFYQSDNLAVATVRQKGNFCLVCGLSEGTVGITVTVNAGNVIKEEHLSFKVETPGEELLPVSNPVNGENYTEADDWKGSRVYFGVIDQDNNIKNGREPILWRVLEVTDDTILLLSEYGLINRFYHDTFENATWETSSLRAWLNTDFLDIAFTRIEINAINDTLVKNFDNKDYGSSGGNKTLDKVFLLSKKEANNTAYGFMKGSRKKSLTRTLKITKSALQEGYLNKDNGNTCWWLRSPGLTNRYASYVFTNGSITDTYFVGYRNDGVRPAIRIKRSSIIFGDEISDGIDSYPRIIAKYY
jgi:hypothetical protein